MAIFALVSPEGGVVQNVVVGSDLDSTIAVVGPCVEVTEDTGPAVIGWNWNPTTGLLDNPNPQQVQDF